MADISANVEKRRNNKARIICCCNQIDHDYKSKNGYGCRWHFSSVKFSFCVCVCNASNAQESKSRFTVRLFFLFIVLSHFTSLHSAATLFLCLSNTHTLADCIFHLAFFPASDFLLVVLMTADEQSNSKKTQLRTLYEGG